VNPCTKYEEPTPEEIAAYEAEVAGMMSRFEKVLPVIHEIKKEHKGTSVKGVKKCPVCGGTLHFTHAACNGHVHGECETTDCVSWME